MRIALDTNILVAAFIAHGTCAELLEHCVRQHEPVTSRFILDELRKTLVSKFGISRRDAAAAVRLLSTRFEIVTPSELSPRVCRDPDDDAVLATAVAGRCDWLVTGDKDLLSLQQYEGVRIVSPRDFWRYEETLAQR